MVTLASVIPTFQRETRKIMVKSIALVFLGVLMGVIGQLSLKHGMNQVGWIGGEAMARPLDTLRRIFSSPYIILAMPLYAGAFLLWTVVLSRLPLSFAYPLLALTYVLVPLAASLVLHESLSVQQWLGITLVVLGVALVGTGTR